MVLRFFLLAVILLFASCTEMGERSNPDDPRGINYRGGQISSISSSHEESSSSSADGTLPSSSSTTQSSSSVMVVGIIGPNVYCQGKYYKTVIIGSQTWMAENLNSAIEGSVCYGGDAANCETYGRLYSWATAMNLHIGCNTSSCAALTSSKHQGICPKDWHIPSKEDWNTLMNAAGGAEFAGYKLKTRSGWTNSEGKPEGNGYDTFGFSAQPGGYGYSNSGFSFVGNQGIWWSTSEVTDPVAIGFGVYFFKEDAYITDWAKSNLFSIRCVKDD
ncbi:MAG: fibrobacter succinogenes major paralogous domain-containing protein [Fibromonadales bacterium]|nr:fibrobacter succinogenes major paralogous domain-containing protein [Fibromonadales bacterium]